MGQTWASLLALPPTLNEALKLAVGEESAKMILRWPEDAVSSVAVRAEGPQRDEMRRPAWSGAAIEGGRPSYTKRLFLLQSMSLPPSSFKWILSELFVFLSWEDIIHRHSTSPPVFLL